MKTVFRAIALACLCLPFYESSAQCNVTEQKIAITNVNPNTCVVTFDLSFTADINSGNKHAVVHLWEDPSGGYPASITYPATTAATAQAKGTLVIKDPGSPVPSYEPVYPSDLGTLTSPYLVPITFRWSDVNGHRVFTFTGLQMSLSSCAVVKYIKGDVYATQNDKNTNGGCLNRNALNLAVNDPSMRGLMMCSNPRSFTVAFSTLNATSIQLQAYRDVAPLGILDENDLDPANLLTITDGIGTTTSKTINNPAQPAGQYTNYGPFTYGPQGGGSQYNVWLVARAGTNTYDNVFLVENTCSILPVTFETFNVAREQNTIALKWTTTKEQNNSGFYIERKTGAENWRSIGFVASKANVGTSSERLTYDYNDAYFNEGVIQYRLKQVDLDGRTTYSEIKAVKNGSQSLDISVFPNPSKGGNVTVMPGGSAIYDMELIDGNGRSINHFKDVKGSKSITGLKSGQYLVIAENKQNGTRVSQKIIVQ